MKLKAMSLIELVVVLTISLVLISVVLAAFRFAAGRELDTVARNMLADLQWTREMAVSQHRNYNITFDIENDTYKIYNGTITAANLVRDQTLNIDLENVTKVSDGSVVTRLSFSSPWGSANNSIVVNLTDAGRARRINISEETGFIRLE